MSLPVPSPSPHGKSVIECVIVYYNHQYKMGHIYIVITSIKYHHVTLYQHKNMQSKQTQFHQYIKESTTYS